MKEKRTISGQNGQVFGHACLLNIATNDVIKFTKNSSFRLMTTPRSCKGQLGPAHEGFYLFIFLVCSTPSLPTFSFIYLTVSQVSLYLSVSTSLSEIKQREDLSWMKKWDMSFFEVICISYNYKYVYIIYVWYMSYEELGFRQFYICPVWP